MNKALICGRLGQDPELKYTTGGTPVTNFGVATNKKWKDKDGNIQEATEWHRVVVWKAQAENCAKYLKKGRQVLIEGELQTREWEGEDGKKNYTTEIVARNVEFVGGLGEKKDSAPGPGDSDMPAANYAEDSIPF